MNNNQARYELMNYFSKEFSCSPDDFLGNTNKVIQNDTPNDAFLKMRCFGNGVVTKADLAIFDWCVSFVKKYTGFRCFDGIQFTQVYQILSEYGFALSCGQGALADLSVNRATPELKKNIRIIEKRGLASFVNNEMDVKEWPMFGGLSDETEYLIAEYVDDTLAGVAFSDQYSDSISDIGYEVRSEYRQRGIATRLTMILTNILIGQNRIPFATTAWSNIASKAVLYKCGYYCAWSNMGSTDMDWATKVINGEAE